MKNKILWTSLQTLIVIDIFLITIEMFFNLSKSTVFFIQFFDFCVCIILICEWLYNLKNSKSKIAFLKQANNLVDLIASIPFDVFLPVVIPQIRLLRYLRLLKLLRIVVLFNRFFNSVERFFKITNLDKIIGGVFFTIIIFTLILFIYGSSYNLFDDFYFVVVTLTTVGYGDIVPATFNEKIITLFLIFAGIFIFSTITAAISSYFTDRLLNVNDETIEKDFNEMFNEKTNILQFKLDNIEKELKIIREENKELNNKIKKLNEKK